MTHAYSTSTTIATMALAAHAAPMTFPNNHWQGAKVAFLGDSITDAAHIGTTRNYWQDLQDILGIEPWVYGINGHTWEGILNQARRLKEEKGDAVDAIIVFAGTNDFNQGIPIGEWWTYAEEQLNSHGKIMTKPRRTPQTNTNTFRGRINVVMAFLKENFPRQQIILLTPIHRGFAEFGGTNVQPDESFPNDIGIYVEEFVKTIREAGDYWAVPVIDLFSTCGLFPLTPSHAQFFHLKNTDLLHPNAQGHMRIGRTLACQLLNFPSNFK